MCGIVAALSSGAPLRPGMLSPALSSLAHRGPDGQGQWYAPDGLAALGHTRLSLIDLKHGQQPLRSEDGEIWAVVNGELYGFEEQRAALIAQGHRFSTGSDSEVLIHLYERYGAHAVSKLRGEFAAVLWDGHKQQLFAFRDRFGIKPLCWTLTAKGELLIASEAKALFALGVEARWDMESLFQCAQLHYTLPDRTMFEGVMQVPPGHLLIASPSKPNPTLLKYWDWDYPIEPTQLDDEETLIARFAAALEDAVKVRMRADVEVGCYLSGGLDSCAILGLMQRQRQAPVKAFTIAFDEPAYDEREIAMRQAAHVGAELHIVEVSKLAALEALEDAVYHGEGLAINNHLSAKYLLSRAVRDAGVKAVLVGEGADEIVAGYPHLRQDLLQSRPQHNLASALSKLEANNTVAKGIFLAHGDGLDLSGVAQTLGFIPAFFKAKASLGHKMTALLSAPLLQRYARRDSYQVVLDQLDLKHQLQGRHPVHQSLYLWSKLALANYILRQIGDSTEMAHSVEGRLPYLDHHLVELAVGLPMTLKIKDLTEKYILREATKSVLTHEVYTRQKHALLAPPTRGQAAAQLIQDTLRSQDFRALTMLDHGKIAAMLDGLDQLNAQERAAMDPVLMLLMSMNALSRRFNLGVA